jgi:DnaK suppressor protein
MTNEFINRAKQRLAERERILTDRLQCIKTDLYHQKQAADPDFEEQGIKRENDEVLAVFMTEFMYELKAIHLALTRIEQNRYEYCRHCGQSIPRERLEALPTASLCIDCSETDALIAS